MPNTNPVKILKKAKKALAEKVGVADFVREPPTGWDEALATATTAQLHTRYQRELIEQYRTAETVNPADVIAMVKDLDRQGKAVLEARADLIASKNGQSDNTAALAMRLKNEGWTDADVHAYVASVARDVEHAKAVAKAKAKALAQMQVD